MNILLLGYGKMGQIIEGLATKNGHTIVAKISSSNRNNLKDLHLDQIDVAIEFTNPSSAVENIKWCLDHGIPVAVGTTGWLDQKDEVDQYCNQKNGTYLYASNFSVGVNLFFELNKQLARLMNAYSSYDPSLLEIHHTQKLDAPSGTAVTLAQELVDELARKTSWTTSSDEEKGSLLVKSERIDPTPGTHIITYSSEVDSIEIRHTAHSRLGFANGALAVAEWLKDQQGIKTMQDYLGIK